MIVGLSLKCGFIITIISILCTLLIACYAQPAGHYQSVGDDFGRTWLKSFMTQNPKPAENKSNSLWTWGGAPRGRIIANGSLITDPYYFWQSLNYTNGWLGKAYTDPKTGYPVYAYIDPYSGYPVYFYIDPRTGNPVYANKNPNAKTLDYYSRLSPFYSSDFEMPASSYYTWVGNAPGSPNNGMSSYDNLGMV